MTTADLTDRQLLELRHRLFNRQRHDELELRGLVAVYDALGYSHRRSKARELCITIIRQLHEEAINATPA